MYSCDFYFDSWYLTSNYWSSETRVDLFQLTCKIQKLSYLSDHTTAKVISLIGFLARVRLIQSTCHPKRKWNISFLSRRVIYEPPLCLQDRGLNNFRICACCVSSCLWESSEQQLFTRTLIKVLSNEGTCLWLCGPSASNSQFQLPFCLFHLPLKISRFPLFWNLLITQIWNFIAKQIN